MQWKFETFREGKLDAHFARRKSIVDISKEIPKFGPGRRGGGYVTECDYCGTVFFTMSRNRHFCNSECRLKFLKNKRINDERKMPDKYTILHKVCSTCSQSFEITAEKIKHGKGVFCSNQCKSRGILKNHMFVWDYKCVVCGRKFRHGYPEHYCSVECRHADTRKPRPQSDVIFLNRKLLLKMHKDELDIKKRRKADLGDKIDHNRYPVCDLFDRYHKNINGVPSHEFADTDVILRAGASDIPEFSENSENDGEYIPLDTWKNIDYDDENVYKLPDGSMSYPKTRRYIMRTNGVFKWSYPDRQTASATDDDDECNTDDENSDPINNDEELTSCEIEDPRIKVLESGYDYGGFEIPPGSTIDDLRPDCYLKIKPC
jgi:hypothetical protein